MGNKPKYNYPASLSLFQFFIKAEKIRKNPIPFHRSFFEKYGDTFSVRLGYSKHLLLSRDKELAKYILQKNHKNYRKSKIQTKFLSKYLGNGLLTANGDFWLKQRRLIQPAFHKQKMEQLVSLMQKTIVAELEDLETNKPIDVFPIMNRLAFNVVASSLFTVSASQDTLLRLQYLIQEVQEFLVKEIRLPHKNWWFKISGQIKKHKNLSQESNAIINEIIEGRKISEEKGDLLDMLLATRYEDTGEPMPQQQLIDEITILFVAGHETTANALSFTTWLLATHPEIQEKVYKEVQQVCKNTSNPIEQIGQLIYTRAVIDEAMRLYPPAWITDRENLEDDTITNFHVKKNTLVGVSFYELHRHPEYWENPDAFIPERFIGEAKKKTAGIYYPFGAGPRMCIGIGFAIFEMVLTVSQIVKTYKLHSNQKSISVNPLITLKPKNAILEFQKRT